MTFTALSDTDECIHGMTQAWCSICRKAAGYRPGTDRQSNDCSVRAIVNVTGATYREAEQAIGDAGKRNGRGATVDQIRDALASFGFVMTSTGQTVESAAADGGTFLAVGWTNGGRKGHAWSIVNGEVSDRWYQRGCRYQIFRVA